MAMSQQHKDALAQGRVESRAIKAYLNALETRRPGRPVTRDSLEKRLVAIDGKIETSDDPLKSVELLQTRLDIMDALAHVDDVENFGDLESGFVEHAKAYSERKGISYSAWREFGVPATTLRTAAIPETRRR